MFYLRFTLACLSYRPGLPLKTATQISRSCIIWCYIVRFWPSVFFKLGFNHGIISYFKEVNPDSYQDGCLISLSSIKPLMTFCKISRVKDALNAAVTTVNKLEFDCM